MNLRVVVGAARSPSTKLFWTATFLGKTPLAFVRPRRGKQPALPCRALATARTGGAVRSPARLRSGATRRAAHSREANGKASEEWDQEDDSGQE